MIRLFALFSALCVGVMARADTITYLVTVNTSSQMGNTASLDLQLNPGTAAPVPAVTATIQYFTGASLEATSIVLGGGAAGQLGNGGTVTLDNATGGSQYTQNVTSFGSQLHFYVTLSGNGVSQSGNAMGSSGSLFELDFIGGNPPQYLFTTDPTGSTADGWVTAGIAVDQTGVPSPLDGGVGVATITQATLPNSVPEPGTWALMGAGLIGVAAWGKAMVRQVAVEANYRDVANASA